MIHYQLRCSADHGFDGWFRDSTSFDRQAGSGLVECPVCGDTTVNRALMAPAIGKRRAVVVEASAPQPAAPHASAEGEVPGKAVAMPDQMRAMLQKLRAEVEQTCDYVGPSFAEEARRMHRGEIDARAIYGESTPEQAEALADDGIEVARIPWVPRSDG